MAEVDDEQLALAGVYSRAMLELAVSSGEADTLLEELRELSALAEENADFEAFLSSPTIDAEVREQSLEKLFRGKASDLLVNSLQILNRKERLGLVRAVAESYRLAHEELRGQIDAHVRTAVKLNDEGKVEDFAINEKCAAGAGAFIEAMGRALEMPLEQMGPLALESHEEIPMNAQCAIFAESEVVGLIHAKKEVKDISKSIHDAMASRIVSMIRRIGVNEDVVMVGGVGLNPGFVEALRKELELDKVYIPDDPAFASAVGAALVAREEG